MPTLANNSPTPEDLPKLDAIAELGVLVEFPDEPPIVRKNGVQQWIPAAIATADGPQGEEHKWYLVYPTAVGAERPTRDEVLTYVLEEARASYGTSSALARMLGNERYEQLYGIIFPPPPKPVFTAASVAPDAIEIDQALLLGIEPSYLGVYKVDRNWGGPEEGGWWYDYYEHVESVVTSGLSDEAVATHRAVLEKKHADEAWGNISSVLGGLEIRVLVEDEPGYYQTKEIPHYE